MRVIKQGVAAAGTVAALVAAFGGLGLPNGQASDARAGHKPPVNIKVFAPENGDNAGISGAGWFVDMELEFDHTSLTGTGFNGLQLTGPGVHNIAAPLPGLFSTGKDDKNPGLVVLTSTTNAVNPGFSGPGTNLANLFNVTGVTDRRGQSTELWDTWLVGAAIAGQDVDTTLTVAEVKDLNHDGIYNDAPDVVLDSNRDGVIDATDLKAIGVDSNIVSVPFHISGTPA
jgi:hypothetical protein